MSGPGGNGGGVGAPLVAPEPGPPPANPDPELEILGARAAQRAMSPEIEFEIRVTDASPRQIHLAALTVSIEVESARRSYAPEARERLAELFGAGSAWSASTANLRLARLAALTGPFEAETTIKLAVPIGYDLEVVAGKYLYALADGIVPLRFHFNGTVYYRGEGGSLQLVQVPWDRSARFEMPVETWRSAVAAHFPEASWVPIQAGALERLRERKAELGAHSYSEAIEHLLDRDRGAGGG